MWKTAPLPYLLIPVQAKILGLFVNTLTADDKFSLLNRGRLLQHVRMQLSQNLKNFTEFFFFFFFHFPNLYSILNILKKKMTLIADVFLNLRALNNVVR